MELGEEKLVAWQGIAKAMTEKRPIIEDEVKGMLTALNQKMEQ